MRADTERKPFDYYIGQIPPGRNDVEIPEKATIEIIINCEDKQFCFHQPLKWFLSLGGDSSKLNKRYG